jgi:hypothetical protein
VNSAAIITERFGFLNHPHEIHFGFGTIKPLAEFATGLDYMRMYGNQDGYIYPPQVRTVRLDLVDPGVQEPIPNTERPAPVFALPMSHELLLSDPIDANDVRHSDAGFLIHLLGFFFGTRLQFCDWNFDGRVPTGSSNSLTYLPDVPEHFISFAYQKWRAWPADLRRRFINIIYMHGRSRSSYWDWDRFVQQYMVFDAIFKFHQESTGKLHIGHRERLTRLCEHYGLAKNLDVLDAIYGLRNELFHEALWDGQTPGTRPSERTLMEKWLTNLNSRLIVALIGYKNQFVGSGWWSFGRRVFDKP